MPACSAYGCTNRPSKKIPGITFHRFPKDESRRELWTAAVRRQNWVPSSCSVLCSKHFSEDLIDRTSVTTVRLREDAVPTIFESFPIYLKKEHKERKPLADRATPPSAANDDLVDNPPSTSDSLANDSFHSTITSTIDETIDNSSMSETSVLKRKIEELENSLENERKNVKILQQKVRRCKKKISKLSDLLEELKEKNLIDNDTFHVLSAASSVNEEFLTRQLNKATNSPLPNRFSPELRTFALTLHFYSPQAYNYVRDVFNLCLPHPRTISKWYQHIEGEPGFTKEALKAIASKIKNANYDILFDLSFDEMCIRRHIEFDGSQFHGYVNLGISESDESMPVAKEAFVLLVVPLNESWKMPTGYFLVDSLISVQRANLVKQALILLHDINAKVVSVTFDGLSANMSMMRELGCNLNPDCLKTTFPHPCGEYEIAVFLDPSHMLN